MELTTDLSQLQPDVRHALIRKLQHEDKARFDLGLVEQSRMKRLHDELPQASYRDDVGPAQMILSQDQWQRAMQFYGTQCFQDPDFAKWLLRNNPDMRVKFVSQKIQVGYTGQHSKGKVTVRHG